LAEIVHFDIPDGTRVIDHRIKFFASLAVLSLLLSFQPGASDEAQAVENKAALADEDARALLDTYCISCHGPDKQKGKVQFDTLDSLEADARADLLNRMHESIRFEEMPPEDKPQPTEAQRQLLDDWIKAQLDVSGASKIDDKLKKPEYGNHVDHEDLFSGAYADLPGFTYDRRWLISEYIFDAKMQRITENRTTANWQGKRVNVLGGHNIRDLSLANPFLLPEKSGVRYYAIDDLTGGHLSTMLSNSMKTSIYITENMIKNGRNKKYLPMTREVLALEDQHDATLVARRKFLEANIATVCENLYGDKNAELLPKFVPVKLKEKKQFSAEDTKKDKRLPVSVASNTLAKSGGWDNFEQLVLDPANKDKSDQELIDLCERVWFFYGDYELDIQGRVAILKDYISDFREVIANNKRAKRIEYKPLDDAEMQAINAAIRKHRKQGDRYNEVYEKCLADWEQQFKQQRIDAGPPSDERYTQVIDEMFVQILERSPKSNETEDYLALVKGYTEKLGTRNAVQKLIQTLLLTSEFAYRGEFGAGEPDEHGRRMLSPHDASYAIAYALTDQSPDETLVEAANSGRLNTREDYKREVTRILGQRDHYYVIDKTLADRWRQDNVTNMPIRELRFFREFFGYPKALKIFKDEKRFGGDRLGSATNRLIGEADRMVAHLLEADQDVFEQLLTTEEFFVYHDGDNARMQARSDEIKRIYEYFKDEDWENFKMEDLTQTHAEFLRTVNMRTIDPDKVSGNRSGNMLQLFKKSMRSITNRMDDGQEHPAPYDLYRGYGNDFMPGYNVGKFWNHDLDNWHYEPAQPAKVPNRKGILTHPAWLIAHAFNTETDPVHRGKWVREKLLAGTIPDVPITVDAQIPEDHNKTLRQRLEMATNNDYCWRCHKEMNPLGNPFEMYDDFGRFRTEEPLEYAEHLIEAGPEQKGDHLVDTRDIYKTLPIDSTGYLEGTGDSTLDGELTGAIDLADRLGKSRRVRQSIIRYAFRYFMGRNETLSDSKTLIDAERAYVDHDGSFDAVIVSLLTSDSFIYRKAIED
jgi:mono/diheme cytochrome c family protein